jgi:hypothetical protein
MNKYISGNTVSKYKAIINNKENGKYNKLKEIDFQKESGDDIYLTEVIAFEKPKADLITVYKNCNGAKLYINGESALKSNEKDVHITNVFNKRYSKAVSSFFKSIGNVEIKLFGFYIKELEQINFFDTYINSCIINWDDFEKITRENKVPTVNVIDSFFFLEEKRLLEIFEKNEHVENVIFRPYFARNISSGTKQELFSYFMKNPKFDKGILIPKKDIHQKANEIMSEVINKDFLNNFTYKAVIENKLLFTKKEDMGNILSIATKMFLQDKFYVKKRDSYLSEINDTNETIKFNLEKEIKKIVPIFIRSIYCSFQN